MERFKLFIRAFISPIGKFINFLFPNSIPKYIYNRLSFNGKFKFKLESNEITIIATSNEIANDIYYSGIFGNYEGYSLEIWYKLNKINTGVVFDVGAYFGVFGLVAAAANKDSEVFCFEPHPRNFRWLEETVSHNTFTNIFLKNYGLSNKNGRIDFLNDAGSGYPPGFTSINHRFVNKEYSALRCEVKDTKEILLNEFKDKQVSLMKLDIERAEYDLLKSCISILSTKTTIFCEILDKEEFARFDELFSDFNYSIFIIDDKKRIIKKVKKLTDVKKEIGRNVLFLNKETQVPSDIFLDI